jgi:hypothetical protein
MSIDRPLYARRMFSHSLVLLRGEAYYSNLKQIPPADRAEAFLREAEALRELFTEKITEYFEPAYQVMLSDPDRHTACWKLLVAVMDQVRNIGLVLLSSAAHNFTRKSSDANKDPIISAHKLVKTYYGVLLGDNTLAGSSIVETVERDLAQAITALKDVIRNERNRATTAEWYELGKPIRGWREADNPYENLLVALLAAQKNAETGDNIAAIGIFWGGVELPIVAGVAAQICGTKQPALGFIKWSTYSEAGDKEGQVWCDLATGTWKSVARLHHDLKITLVNLMDDNALSGGTLESVRDVMLQSGVPNVQTWVVRFSGERREGQMRKKGSGLVDPAYLETRLFGFLGETPYARSYSQKVYESPDGLFNTARSRVLRCLHNNGFATLYKREGF